MNNIPLETAFMSNSSRAWRDPNIKNRIHFRLPDNWVHQISNNSKVIGIRNMFIARKLKHPVIEINCNLNTQIVNYVSGTVSTTSEQLIASRRLNIDYIFDYGTELKDYVTYINKMCESIDFSDNLTVQTSNTPGLSEDVYENLKHIPKIRVYYEYIEDSNNYNRCRLVFDSPFNSEREVVRSYWPSSSTSENQTVITYFINFDINLLNNDAESIFTNFEVNDDFDNNTRTIYYNDIWDRNSCIIYSNISEECDNGYLGFTRKLSITPEIKCYKVNNNNNTFWVDLYSSNDRKTPVQLPEYDELIIEAQLL